MLFKYALPEDVSRHGMDLLALSDPDPIEVSKTKRYDRLARWALSMLVGGFLLQLVGNMVQLWPELKQLLSG